MKLFFKYSTLIFFALAVVSCSKKEDVKQDIVSNISSVPKLITSECILRQIVSKNDKQLLLPGDRILVLAVKSRVKIGFDLSKITPDKIFVDGEKCTIELPNPEVLFIESHIENILQHTELFRFSYEDSEIAEVGEEAAQKIREAVAKLNIDEQIKRDAAYAMLPMLKKLGFEEKNITFNFSRNFKMENLTDRLNINLNLNKNGK